jgi:hypothetical protein
MLTRLALLALFAPRIRSAPYPEPTPVPISNTQDLAKRCNDGDCSYGGTAQTLTANTVTTTVLSTTSVPCYVTTYVTDSTTTTSTVYSTDIITSIVTEKGIVTVIKYQPTPLLKSSVYESVIEITQTGTTFWQETTGSAYDETITGTTETIGGGTSGGKSGYGHGQGNAAGWGGASGTTVLISTATATGQKSAWTHATAAAAGVQGVTTINANGQAVTTAAAAGGWANAVAGTNAATRAGAATTVDANGVSVNWSGAWSKEDLSSVMVILGALGTVLIFEVCRHLS